jgi:GAF domain-containing protein
MRITRKMTTAQSRPISVRVQILLGFSVILLLALLIAIIGYTNLRSLQQEAETTLETAGRVRELSLQVENEFLSARQAETAFLDTWRYIGNEAALAEHAAANKDHLAQAYARLNELDTLAQRSGDRSLQPLLEKTANLRPLLHTYEEAFRNLVAFTTDLSRSDGLEASMDSTLTFQEITRDINTITTQIGVDGEMTLAIARARLKVIGRRSSTELILTTVIALGVGIVAAYLLGRQITSPLRRLSQAAEQIGQGNLQQHLEVTGGYELATLANSFNSMVAQLRQVLGRLEQLVTSRTRALEASVEVSRSLSTILDQKQLVSEVVKQIQNAFHYYHAHIYLFDDKHEYLVMAGGTGEAGLAMLGRGHKIPQGKGLVGRAAASNYVVLVPDVSQEADWLSNPLLPETRSEVAVPIAMGDQVLGVLDVQHHVTDGLTREDARLLQSVASQVAIALRNARLFQEAQQRAEREALINAISQKIRNANSLERVLQVTAQELGRALNTQKTSVRIGAIADRQNGG